MTTYEPADKHTIELAQRLMREHHRELTEAGVTLAILMAHAPTDPETDIPLGPALKHQGFAAAGLTRIINLKDRAKGMPDAEILLDGDLWDEWYGPQQEALLDHELQHLEVKLDRGKAVQRDDLKRPMLRLRKHDHQFGWFDAIAERHRGASLEVQQATAIVEKTGQLYFPWATQSSALLETATAVLETARRAGRKSKQAIESSEVPA